MWKPLLAVYNLLDDARFQELENRMSTTLSSATWRLNQQEVPLQTHTDKFTSLTEGDVVLCATQGKQCVFLSCPNYFSFLPLPCGWLARINFPKPNQFTVRVRVCVVLMRMRMRVRMRMRMAMRMMIYHIGQSVTV